MKYLNILALLIVLCFTSAVFAQEKTEKPKETEKSKEVEKPKDVEKPKTTDPHSFIFQFWGPPRGARQKPGYISSFADVTDVELIFEDTENKDYIEYLCSPEKPPGVEIITKSTNPDYDFLTYNYTVSGGKIVGQGEKVFWDLSNVKPGTYTVTVASDNGCGFCGKTITKTVVVK